MLADESLDMVLLDELTYMVAYDYLPLETVLTALRNRPVQQTVIITGRGCHREIIELADTVSELRPVKHAFDAGIKPRWGLITKRQPLQQRMIQRQTQAILPNASALSIMFCRETKRLRYSVGVRPQYLLKAAIRYLCS